MSRCGRICFATKKVNFCTAFDGQKVGIKEQDDGIWQMSFMDYEVGYFDLESCRVEPVDNPFGAKVLTMSPPVWFVKDVSGTNRQILGWLMGLEPTTTGITKRPGLLTY